MQTDLFPEDEPEAAGVPASQKAARLAALITLRDIAMHVGDTAFHRGHKYMRQSRVIDLTVSPDCTELKAKVEGSEPKPYSVNVTIKVNPGRRTEIEGHCSCPLGYNCKHVAAALLEALHEDAAKGPSAPNAAVNARPAAPAAAAKAPVPMPPAELPYEVTSWLQQLAQSATGDEYPAEISQRVLYLIVEQRRANSSSHLAVEVISVRILKKGGFSNTVSHPGLSNFYLGNWPRYFRFSDIEICQSLLVARNGYDPNVYALKSFGLLKKIVATGRAYWENHLAKPLTMGEPKPGTIEWVMPDSKGMRPQLTVEGAAVALNAEPPVYVDPLNALIGEVTLPVAPHVSYKLLSAPAIPAMHVEQVSHSLARHLPAETGLVPKPPEPPVIVDDGPTPVLRLMLAKETIPTYYRVPIPSEMPVARLSFRYGPVDVWIGEVNLLVETVKANRRYQARRRPTREKQAIAKLIDFDFAFARDVYTVIAPKHHNDFALPDTAAWLGFLAQDVPELQAQGFEIYADDDFPYRVAKLSGELDTEVFEGTGVDWFELGMGIQVDGEKLDLGPILAELVMTEKLDPTELRKSVTEDGDFFVKLSDGRHLALAAKRFLPVIIALHELTLGGAMVSKNGRLQVSKAETTLLGALEEQAGLVFKGGEKLRSLARTLRSINREGIAAVALPDSFKATLRGYQAQGVAWLNLLREVGLGGILADDMGLGKTVQILALLSAEKAEGRLRKPALIVVPTSLMTNWLNEARKFAPELKVLVLHGATRKDRFDEIAQHDVVLTTYPLIARDQAVLLAQGWQMAILDEAQTIKNPNAATTRLIRELKSDQRFCLTGTPMENHLGELWSLMSFVNPGYLGDKAGFQRRWRTPIEKYADAERSRILSRRVKPFMLRRTKQEVARELPEKTEITETITLDEQQRDVYDSIRLSMHKKVREAIAAKGFSKSHIIILEALLKLRQVCCDPRLLKLSTEKAPPSAKLERLMEMVQELLAEGRKIIVFSQFTSMLDLILRRLMAAGIDFSLLTGETRDRGTAIENFQNGRVSVFLVSLKAGGVGLNLTAADTVILYDPWWNPAVEEQAIDRAYRIGQDKPVFVYRLVASQTIEEKMDELKAKKRALAQSIFDQAGNPTSALTEEDLNSLFEV